MTTPTITSADAKALIAEQLAVFATDPESFPAALAARAKMPHRYSVGNMLLILKQAGDRDVLADRIAPRSVWAKEGYEVGGMPCFIWSKPLVGRKLSDGRATFRKAEIVAAREADDGRDFAAFRLEPTYPAAQAVGTDGRTAQHRAEPLTGEPAEVYGRLAGWLTSQGWTVELRPVDQAGGWTSHDERLIRIDPRFAGWDRVRVLVHEAAHALMHGSDDQRPYAGEHRGDMEAEADGVAFAVLSAYGQQEAAARTVRYVAGWAEGDTVRIQAAMERASAALDSIIDAAAGREVAEVRQPKTGKADNRALAAWLRENDLPVRGPVWSAAKSGTRDLSELHALAA